MEINEGLLRKVYPNAGKMFAPCIPYFSMAMSYAKIVEPMDQCIFLTQMGHECDNFNTLREYADGSDYEGRLDLGNTEPGDGRRYPGRGGIQITGRAAYRACGRYFNQNFEDNPHLLESPMWAIHASAWFWVVYKPPLQPASKRGWLKVTTRIVNGGYNGWDDRLTRYQRNSNFFGVPQWSAAREDQLIREFQRERGLGVDGDAGQATFRELMRTR